MAAVKGGSVAKIARTRIVLISGRVGREIVFRRDLFRPALVDHVIRPEIRYRPARSEHRLDRRFPGVRVAGNRLRRIAGGFRERAIKSDHRRHDQYRRRTDNHFFARSARLLERFKGRGGAEFYPLQIRKQRIIVLIPILRPLGCHSLDERLDRCGQLGAQLFAGGQRFVGVRQDECKGGRAVVGMAARQKIEQGDAEGINVCAMIHACGVFRLLGSQEMRRTKGGSGGGKVKVFRHYFGQAEIGDFDVSGGSEEEIVRLDVAMNDVFFAGGLQCQRRLGDHVQRF